MARRSEIFTPENIQLIAQNSPFLFLFQKQDWMEYLELIAQLYDLIEEEGAPVEFSRVKALIESFYAPKGAEFVAAKTIQFISMAIEELGVFRDSHDAQGLRYLEATREGKALLKLSEGFILNRKKFTGTGADTLLGTLNNLLLDQQSFSLEEALDHHRQKIKSYRADMEKMKEHGVQAGELLGPSFSAEELLVQAEEAATHLLSAGEDIKMAVEEARRSLIIQYRKKDFSVGQAVEYAADFYEKLRHSPEYASYAKAKDILSYLEGLGAHYAQKDVANIIERLQEKNILIPDRLRQSSLVDFSSQFQTIIQGIEAKVQEQVNLLRIQIHYVLSSDSKRVHENLKQLLALIHEQRLEVGPQEVQACFAKNPHKVSVGFNLSLGPITYHDLQVEEEEVLEKPQLNSLDPHEMALMMELMRQAEERTIEKVLERLSKQLSRLGEIHLSRYPLEYGIIEYYVLCYVEAFSEQIASENLGLVDLCFYSGQREFILRKVQDKRFYFV